jgi:hypothetical protein
MTATFAYLVGFLLAFSSLLPFRWDFLHAAAKLAQQADLPLGSSFGEDWD